MKKTKQCVVAWSKAADRSRIKPPIPCVRAAGHQGPHEGAPRGPHGHIPRWTHDGAGGGTWTPVRLASELVVAVPKVVERDSGRDCGLVRGRDGESCVYQLGHEGPHFDGVRLWQDPKPTPKKHADRARNTPPIAPVVRGPQLPLVPVEDQCQREDPASDAACVLAWKHDGDHSDGRKTWPLSPYDAQQRENERSMAETRAQLAAEQRLKENPNDPAARAAAAATARSENVRDKLSGRRAVVTFRFDSATLDALDRLHARMQRAPGGSSTTKTWIVEELLRDHLKAEGEL